jgi:uncharacterized surface protein with fasciclin (FAS1) repeats
MRSVGSPSTRPATGNWPVRLARAAGLAAAAGLVAVLGTACGTSPPSPARPTGPPPIPSTGSASPAPSTGRHVGAECGVVPVRGTGSFGSMNAQRTAAAAASNPQLSVFSSAIRSAALTEKLDKMRSFTIFIPVNSAFAALPRPDIAYLRKPANLIRVIRHQIVPAEVTPARIAQGGSVQSLSGSKLVLRKRDGDYQVSRATVLCGNIKTANGTIYLIDKVLLPPGSPGSAG